jgi:membrane protease YdiL (CAAX protease family)
LEYRSLLWLVLGVPVVGGALYYLKAAQHLRQRGGRVGVQFFGLPDLFLTCSLGLYFAASGVMFLMKAEPQPGLRPEQVWNNAGFMTAMLVLVLVFVGMRPLPLLKAFHLGWDAASQFLLRAALALLTALPPIYATSLLWEKLLPANGQEQALVSLFRNSVETGDSSAVWVVVASAFLGAPLQEEILFRGYFYVTLKRYIGAVGSALVVSLLFAVCHGYAGVIPGLFVLSLCQTVLLERYGSLWVCIAMHACFNGLGLVQLYVEARGWMPH